MRVALFHKVENAVLPNLHTGVKQRVESMNERPLAPIEEFVSRLAGPGEEN